MKTKFGLYFIFCAMMLAGCSGKITEDKSSSWKEKHNGDIEYMKSAVIQKISLELSEYWFDYLDINSECGEKFMLRH